MNFDKNYGDKFIIFDWKMALRLFTFNSGVILPRADYGIETKQ